VLTFPHFSAFIFLSVFLVVCRQKLKAQDNHGMIYTARLKAQLHMIYLQILSRDGGRQQNGGSWDGVLKKHLTGMMMPY